jgi:hypothetical protein
MKIMVPELNERWWKLNVEMNCMVVRCIVIEDVLAILHVLFGGLILAWYFAPALSFSLHALPLLYCRSVLPWLLRLANSRLSLLFTEC